MKGGQAVEKLPTADETIPSGNADADDGAWRQDGNFHDRRGSPWSHRSGGFRSPYVVQDGGNRSTSFRVSMSYSGDGPVRYCSTALRVGTGAEVCLKPRLRSGQQGKLERATGHVHDTSARIKAAFLAQESRKTQRDAGRDTPRSLASTSTMAANSQGWSSVHSPLAESRGVAHGKDAAPASCSRKLIVRHRQAAFGTPCMQCSANDRHISLAEEEVHCCNTPFAFSLRKAAMIDQGLDPQPETSVERLVRFGRADVFQERRDGQATIGARSVTDSRTRWGRFGGAAGRGALEST